MSIAQLGQRQAWQRIAVSLPPVQRSLLVQRICNLAQPTFRTRPVQTRAYHILRRPQWQARNRISSNIAKKRRRWNSSSADANVKNTSDAQLSISQRLKKLSREYGWTAVGVYFALSVLDFPFCFLAVRWIGTDTIGHWEHVIVSRVKQWIPWGQKDAAPTVDAKAAADEEKRVLDVESAYEVTEHGYREAEKANSGSNASLWTQLALAYAVHKSFIFVRVPLTAALLPKVVKTLRGWGYNIGKRTPKKIEPVKSGVNTKGSGVKPEKS